MSDGTSSAAPALEPPGHVEPKPYSPRYRWARRVAIGLAAYLLLVVGLRVTWGILVEARVQREVADLQARGLPIFTRESHAAVTHGEDNAVTLLLRAASQCRDIMLGECSVTELSGHLERARACLDEVRTTLDRNRPCFETIAAARAAPRMEWPIQWSTPRWLTPPPPLGEIRYIARWLLTDAARAHLDGDDRSAVERIDDTLFLSEVLHGQHTGLGFMVAFAVENLALDCLAMQLPALGVEARPGLERIRDELLAEETLQRNLQWMLAFERVQSLELFELLADGEIDVDTLRFASPHSTLKSRVTALLIGPLFRMSWLEMNDGLFRPVEAGVTTGSWPSEEAYFDWHQSDGKTFGLRKYVMNETVWNVYGIRYMVQQNLAMRRMAAVAIAIRLYEMDHGRRPNELTALVPDYLPGIPLDPYSPWRRALSYRPDLDPPRLYSVFVNEIDDGGKVHEGPRSWTIKKGDLPYYLDAPSTPGEP